GLGHVETARRLAFVVQYKGRVPVHGLGEVVASLAFGARRQAVRILADEERCGRRQRRGESHSHSGTAEAPPAVARTKWHACRRSPRTTEATATARESRAADQARAGHPASAPERTTAHGRTAGH